MTPLWLVTVHDKETIGEVDVAMALVESEDEEDAKRVGLAMVEQLTAKGRCRCVYQVKRIMRGFHYRVGALIRLVHNQ